MSRNTISQAQLQNEASKENKAITLFIVIFTILGLFSHFVTNQPTPNQRGQISAVSESIR
jgi:hypothetical protein